MLLYYSFILLVLFFAFIFFIRFFLQSKERFPVDLFIHALRDENSGHFEEAVITYETALDAFKKIKPRNRIKAKIIQKIKVLNGVIAHRKNSIFIR